MWWRFACLPIWFLSAIESFLHQIAVFISLWLGIYCPQWPRYPRLMAFRLAFFWSVLVRLSAFSPGPSIVLPLSSFLEYQNRSSIELITQLFSCCHNSTLANWNPRPWQIRLQPILSSTWGLITNGPPNLPISKILNLNQMVWAHICGTCSGFATQLTKSFVFEYASHLLWMTITAISPSHCDISRRFQVTLQVACRSRNFIQRSYSQSTSNWAKSSLELTSRSTQKLHSANPIWSFSWIFGH